MVLGGLLVAGAVFAAHQMRLRQAALRSEQRGYVRLKLRQSTDLKLVELGYRQTWSRMTVSEDLTKAIRESGPLTRRLPGGRAQALTNAAVSYRYLGDGRWFVSGSGQLSDVQFEISTLKEMARGPLPIPPAPVWQTAGSARC